MAIPCFLTQCTLVTVMVILWAAVVESGNAPRKRSTYPYTWKIGIVREKPFVMVKDSKQPMSGNDMYEGFLIDLIAEICKRLDCKYELKLPMDGVLFKDNEDGTYGGLVGEARSIPPEIHMIAGPLTISNELSLRVDLSHAYMMNPSTMLMRDDVNITSISQLLSKPNIRIGTLRDGTTHSALQEKVRQTAEPPWKALLDRLNTQESKAFFDSENEAVGDIQFGNFIFLHSKPKSEYISAKSCNLATAGEFLDVDKGYAFAFPEGSRHIEEVNEVLAYLARDGVVEEFQENWWSKECYSIADIEYPTTTSDEVENKEVISTSDNRVPSSVLLTAVCIAWILNFVYLK